MKKSMFLLFAAVLIMGSCKKDVFVEKPEEETKAKGISEKGGIIQFSTFDVYRQFLENPDQSKQLAVIKAATQNSGFKSLKSVCLERSDPSAPTANTVSNLPLDIEDYGIIAELLNSEGIAQIGDYLFIIDFTNEKCYALHTQWETDRAKYADFINGVTTNDYVFEFSFDEQAVEILSNIGSPAIKANGFNAGEAEFAFCGDPKVQNANDDGTEISKNSTYRLSCKVKYIKLAIYFSLVSKMDLEIRTLIFGWGLRDYGQWSAMTSSYFWKFKPKCWNERVQAPTVYRATLNNNRYIERPWSSTRALTKYWMEFTWYTKGNQYLEYYELTSRKYAIKAGY